MENMKIGLLLQNLRKQKNLTQLELATILNVTHQSVSKWENGDSIPDVAMLKSIASFYQITVDEILNGELKSKAIINSSDKQIYSIIRLACVILVFISLFFFYVNSTISLSELNPFSNWNPFNINEMKAKVYLRGFNLVFNAQNLNFFTAGGWLIFISVLILLTVFILNIVADHKQLALRFLNEANYLKIKKITEISLLLGFSLIIIGAVFKSVGINIGFFLGLLGSIGLFLTNYLETKRLI